MRVREGYGHSGWRSVRSWSYTERVSGWCASDVVFFSTRMERGVM